jgi:hypothetical protein
MKIVVPLILAVVVIGSVAGLSLSGKVVPTTQPVQVQVLTFAPIVWQPASLGYNTTVTVTNPNSVSEEITATCVGFRSGGGSYAFAEANSTAVPARSTISFLALSQNGEQPIATAFKTSTGTIYSPSNPFSNQWC